MSDIRYLSGRVVVRSLPVYEGLPGLDAPLTRRLRLPRGELAQIYDAEAGIRYLACIELREGAIRGNHFHREKMESVYVIQGEVEVTVGDVATPERAAFVMRPGDLVTVAAGVAHALRPLRPGQAVEFAPGRYDAADTHPFPLVQMAMA